MAIFNNFPWADYHNLNLTWLIKTMKDTVNHVDKLDKQFNDEVKDKVTEYVNDHLWQFILGAMYDEPNTAIRLQGVQAIDSDHIYTAQTEEIRVIGR